MHTVWNGLWILVIWWIIIISKYGSLCCGCCCNQYQNKTSHLSRSFKESCYVVSASSLKGGSVRLPVNSHCIILHIQHKIQIYFGNCTDYTENTTVILVLLVSNHLVLLAFGEMSVRTGRVDGIPQRDLGQNRWLFSTRFSMILQLKVASYNFSHQCDFMGKGRSSRKAWWRKSFICVSFSHTGTFLQKKNHIHNFDFNRRLTYSSSS